MMLPKVITASSWPFSNAILSMEILPQIKSSNLQKHSIGSSSRQGGELLSNILLSHQDKKKTHVTMALTPVLKSTPDMGAKSQNHFGLSTLTHTHTQKKNKKQTHLNHTPIKSSNATNQTPYTLHDGDPPLLQITPFTFQSSILKSSNQVSTTTPHPHSQSSNLQIKILLLLPPPLCPTKLRLTSLPMMLPKVITASSWPFSKAILFMEILPQIKFSNPQIFKASH